MREEIYKGGRGRKEGRVEEEEGGVEGGREGEADEEEGGVEGGREKRRREKNNNYLQHNPVCYLGLIIQLSQKEEFFSRMDSS